MPTQTAIPETPQTGRDENGVPSITGLGDGTITSKGDFVPAKEEAKIDFASKLRAVQAEQQKIVELPDGSVRVNIVVPAEKVEVLKAWAEGAQEEWFEYLQRMIEMGLDAVMNSGSVAG